VYERLFDWHGSAVRTTVRNVDYIRMFSIPNAQMFLPVWHLMARYLSLVDVFGFFTFHGHQCLVQATSDEGLLHYAELLRRPWQKGIL